MLSRGKSRPLLLFYILVSYVLLQFGWWSYMLVQLNNEVHQQKLLLIELKQSYNASPSGSADLQRDKNELDSRLSMRRMMILGEGAVFLALLTWGILQTRRSFKREAALAARQRNFLLSVTHELKSPLASARLMHETILHRNLPPEILREMIRDATDEIDRLHLLVDNILTAARIENHTFDVHKELLDFSALVEDTITKSGSIIRQTHTLKTSITPGLMTEADKIVFPSVLNNLLENAQKYAPKNSTITVELTAEQKVIRLRVRDEGPGIPDHEKAAVFEKFYRIGNEETRQSKGTGLGLFIVHSLADAQGWKIRIENNVPQGAVFIIEIPTTNS